MHVPQLVSKYLGDGQQYNRVQRYENTARPNKTLKASPNRMCRNQEEILKQKES